MYSGSKEMDKGASQNLLGVSEDTGLQGDNEVPPDLLVSPKEESGKTGKTGILDGLDTDRDDSENEVPLEFLAEHRGEEDD